MKQSKGIKISGSIKDSSKGPTAPMTKAPKTSPSPGKSSNFSVSKTIKTSDDETTKSSVPFKSTTGMKPVTIKGKGK